MALDIAFDVEKGDVMLSGGDFATVDKEAEVLQLAVVRVKTDNPDWFYHPTIGADLSRLVGMRNRPETARQGEAQIQRCLQVDKLVGQPSARGVPISETEMAFFVDLGVGRFTVTQEVGR